MPEQLLNAGQQLDGFEVERVQPIPALYLTAYLIRHPASGARFCHLHNEDAENLYAVAIPTPPADDTGLPHIMEHAVLAGSRQFPVRDPFFEMYKSSMATFINAMTAMDATYYPVASNVKADLFNLMEVYFDAVFHPLITREIFEREGWHLEPVDPNDPTGDLKFTGIVFNEMKGAFSNPEMMLARLAIHHLLPETCYGKESGGDPQHIPELTYEQFMDFYRSRYHPSNALFVCYGNIPTTEYLDFLRPRLAEFSAQSPAPLIERQPRWTNPRSVRESYPIDPNQSQANGTYAKVDWLCADATDPQDTLDMHLLSTILLGNEAAPLKMAIVNARLGEDLVQSGFSAAGCEGIFRVGIKGTERQQVVDFEKLVLDTLRQVADQPMNEQIVDTAFQQVSYSFLEMRDMTPLIMADRVVDNWIYGGDPLLFLNMRQHLEDCRARYRQEPTMFNRLIQQRLLDNPHRITFTLEPDPQWQARYDTEFTERANQIRQQLTDDQARQIAEHAEQLNQQAGTPNTPEQLAALPHLQTSDLPAQPQYIPTQIRQLAQARPMLVNDVFANGINYLELDFNLAHLPEKLRPYLSIYCQAIRKLGIVGQDYKQVAQRTAAATRGINASVLSLGHYADPQQTSCHLRFSMQTLDERAPTAMAVLHDLLFDLDPDDNPRMRDALTQLHAAYRIGMTQQGTAVAIRHAMRNLHPAAMLEHQIHGLPQLDLTHQLTEDFQSSYAELVDNIRQITRCLANANRLTVSFTGSHDICRTVSDQLNQWITDNMDHDPIDTVADYTLADGRTRLIEGLAAPMQIAHAAMAMPSIHATDPRNMALKVGTHLVSFDWMLPEIRFKGNAYGAGARYDATTGSLALFSFRDPHTYQTITTMGKAVEFLTSRSIDQSDIDRAIIALAKQYHQPIRPTSVTAKALNHHLAGLTDRLLADRYRQLLAVTADQAVTTTVDLLNRAMPKANLCIISSREKLDRTNQQLTDQPLAIRDIVQE